MSVNVENEDDEQEVPETTLFEDLERIQREHELEDNKTLEEAESVEDEDYVPEPSEEEKETATLKLFIDDGKLDYDAKFPLRFDIEEIASHFNLKEDELKRFSGIYEKIHRLQLSQVVYNKSLQDQLKQKGNKMDISRAVNTWANMLDKLCDIKMLDFLCDLVEMGELKAKIIDKEIEKLFSKPVINLNKTNNLENTISDQLTSITRKLSKAGV